MAYVLVPIGYKMWFETAGDRGACGFPGVRSIPEFGWRPGKGGCNSGETDA